MPGFFFRKAKKYMKPIVQISLDLTDLQQAYETAELALKAGVDWLEAGTPLILAEGLHAIRGLRERFLTLRSLPISRPWMVVIWRRR